LKFHVQLTTAEWGIYKGDAAGAVASHLNGTLERHINKGCSYQVTYNAAWVVMRALAFYGADDAPAREALRSLLAEAYLLNEIGGEPSSP
jgi:hypothetical protein